MTVIDRILCRFGFHGPQEHVKTVRVYEDHYTEGDLPIYNKVVRRCTICHRLSVKKI